MLVQDYFGVGSNASWVLSLSAIASPLSGSALLHTWGWKDLPYAPEIIARAIGDGSPAPRNHSDKCQQDCNSSDKCVVESSPKLYYCESEVDEHEDTEKKENSTVDRVPVPSFSLSHVIGGSLSVWWWLTERVPGFRGMFPFKLWPWDDLLSKNPFGLVTLSKTYE